MSLVPFTVANRQSMKCSASPPHFYLRTNFWLARGHRLCSPVPGSNVVMNPRPPHPEANVGLVGGMDWDRWTMPGFTSSWLFLQARLPIMWKMPKNPSKAWGSGRPCFFI